MHQDAPARELRAAALEASASGGRLQCVVLNGCDTAELGAQIVQALPWVRVVCWAGLAEDAAARAFAAGLYDALGAFVAARKPLDAELVGARRSSSPALTQPAVATSSHGLEIEPRP